MKTRIFAIICFLLCIITLACSCASNQKTSVSDNSVTSNTEQSVSNVTSKPKENQTENSQEPFVLPDFDGETAYIIINDNIPYFKSDEITAVSFESYSPLDDLGRCGVAVASVGVDIMPTEERGAIGSVKPSGWHTVKYDIVDGKYLYNRCHLIGFQLTGENANKENLITGTRYFNIEGMLLFENMVADYVKETENHVMYRVTPVFEGNDLVAKGVYIEAYSVEDNGEGICFNIFAYNAQPGVEIDYLTGESRLIGENAEENADSAEKKEYVLNTSSKKIHLQNCKSAGTIKEENKSIVYESIDELKKIGYEPCKACKP